MLYCFYVDEAKGREICHVVMTYIFTYRYLITKLCIVSQVVVGQENDG